MEDSIEYIHIFSPQVVFAIPQFKAVKTSRYIRRYKNFFFFYNKLLFSSGFLWH